MIPKPLLLFVILLGLTPSLALAQSAASPWTAPALQAAPPTATALPPANPLADLYPERAQRMGVEGDASVRCVVTTTGTLTSCAVVSERPAGFGFGEATIRAAQRRLMKPAMRNGVPVEGVVTIPMGWRLGHDQPPVASPAPQP